MLLPLALSLVMSWSLPYTFAEEERPVYSTVPPPGKVNLIVAHMVYDTFSGGERESCWVERGSGTGLRRIRNSRGINEEFEGFANGLEYPDRSTTWADDSGGNFGWVIHRIAIPSGNRWNLDTLPGYPMPSRAPGIPNLIPQDTPDSLFILHDEQGRETTRRSYSRGYYRATHKVWGHGGVVVEIDSSCPMNGDSCSRIRLDSTTWKNGSIVGRIQYYLPSQDYPLPFRDSSVWEDGRVVFNAEFLDYHTPQDTSTQYIWHFGNALGDTLTVTTTRDGTPIDSFHQPLVTVPPVEITHKGDTIAFYYPGGGTFKYLDSTVWGSQRICLLEDFDAQNPSEAAVHLRIYYTYATLDASTGIARVQEPPRLTLRQQGRILRWTGTVPDGATVQLRSVDGRQLGSTSFHNGSAAIERTHAQGLVLWLVEADGACLGNGSILTH